MESLKIVVLGVLSGAAYGVIHDQVTARICIEYFTIFHPAIFPTTSPTLLALGWGILATWWVGAILGVLLALAARAGSRPQLNAADLVRPIGELLLVMGVSAALFGFLGFLLSRRGVVSPPELVRYELAPFLHAHFMADWWAHNASYAVGFVGGIMLCVMQYRRRVSHAGTKKKSS